MKKRIRANKFTLIADMNQYVVRNVRNTLTRGREALKIPRRGSPFTAAFREDANNTGRIVFPGGSMKKRIHLHFYVTLCNLQNVTNMMYDEKTPHTLPHQRVFWQGVFL